MLGFILGVLISCIVFYFYLKKQKEKAEKMIKNVSDMSLEDIMQTLIPSKEEENESDTDLF